MVEMVQKRRFYANGLRFACARCSSCCRYESGFVFLSAEDVACLERALGVGHEEFVSNFCRWVPMGDGTERLSLREKTNYDCVFWAERGCSVYEHRPVQCRAFPFWASAVSSKDAWQATAADCPGIGQGTLFSQQDIESRLTARQNEPIIFKTTGGKI